MRLSRTLFPTLKEPPSDADTPSARLMLRAGMIRKVASGLYDWLPVGLRVLRRVERIVRDEMNRIGGQEVWLPFVQPRDLWVESGRWGAYGKEMLRFKDRKDTEFCLAPTAEEVITDLVRREVRSYRDLPLLLYQFGLKFRDEIRPRFGVMRAREFYMKDAYSFHADDADAEATYHTVLQAYTRVFERCGLRCRAVEADTGAIGGRFSHEFMVLADTGEETLVSCAACGYAANVERADTPPPDPMAEEPPSPVEAVATPGARTVDEVAAFFNVPPERVIKCLFFMADGRPLAALVRGDREINEAKLKRVWGADTLRPATDDEYRAAAGCEPGYGGPVGLAVPVVADPSAMAVPGGVCGANRTDTHLRHVRPGRDFMPARTADIRKIFKKDPCPKCQSGLYWSKGIEVGHAFKLGARYSTALRAGFLTEKGEKTPFLMGCYGIGVSRVVAAAIEQNHDANGIVWPEALAPYDVAILPLNMDSAPVRDAAERLDRELTAAGWETLLDDRDQRAGVKFKDADLLGLPWRVTVGEKKLNDGRVEIKRRNAAHGEDVPLGEAAAFLQARRSTRSPGG